MAIKLGYISELRTKVGLSTRKQICTFVALNNMLAITTGQCIETTSHAQLHRLNSEVAIHMNVVDLDSQKPITSIKIEESIFGIGNKDLSKYTTIINLGIFTVSFLLTRTNLQ